MQLCRHVFIPQRAKDGHSDSSRFCLTLLSKREVSDRQRRTKKLHRPELVSKVTANGAPLDRMANFHTCTPQCICRAMRISACFMTARPQQSAATEVTTPYMAARTTACHLISSITLIGTAGFSFLAHLCVCYVISFSFCISFSYQHPQCACFSNRVLTSSPSPIMITYSSFHHTALFISVNLSLYPDYVPSQSFNM